MRGRAVYIYATAEDWMPRILAFEQKYAVEYVRSGMFEEAAPSVFTSVTEIAEMGKSRTGDSVSDSTYVIVPRGGEIHSREVVLNQGGVRYVIDHGTTPASVIWRPGGIFEQGRAVIRGDISILPMHPTAIELFGAFSRQATRGFLRKKGYRLGPAALGLYKRGYRLTTGVMANPVCDLNLGNETSQRRRQAGGPPFP